MAKSTLRPPARAAARPTQREVEILEVLWRKGDSTVREIFDELGGEIGYTTVLKLMQIMHEKGLLARDDRARTHVYRATQPESQTQRRLVADLIARAFGGSSRKLIVAALQSKRASRQELEEIRKLLDEMKGDAL